MRSFFHALLILFLPSEVLGQEFVYVLPVQSEIPFLAQMPGTNVFVGPGAASIFKGKVTINGKEYKKFPEPPLNPPEWANGLKERIERAIGKRPDLKVAKSKDKSQYVLRMIVTRFGKDERDEIGVTFEGAILNGKTQEVLSLVKGFAVETETRNEPESLSWPDFIEVEERSSLGIATNRAAEDLAKNTVTIIRALK